MIMVRGRLINHLRLWFSCTKRASPSPCTQSNSAMSESLEGIASLRKLLAKRAKCSEAVIEFILQPEEEGGLGMESVADLAG